MPFVFGDRVKESSTTVGVADMTLIGAAIGFRTFSAGIGTGNSCYYTIVHDTADPPEWEVGIGTVVGAILSRDSVISSTNGGAAVNFTPGTKTVFSGPTQEFFNEALDEPKHDALDHTGVPGVPPPESFTSGVHALTNHFGLPGVPAAEAFTQPVHDLHDHEGLPGVPTVITATAGSGGADEGTVSADSDKGLDIAGGVMEVKVDGTSIGFNGSGEIERIGTGAGFTLRFTMAFDGGQTNAEIYPMIIVGGDNTLAGFGNADRVLTSDTHAVPAPGNITRVVLYNLFDSSTGSTEVTALSISVNGTPTALSFVAAALARGDTQVITLGTPIAVVAGDTVTFSTAQRNTGVSFSEENLFTQIWVET